jgi:hypothetical protein
MPNAPTLTDEIWQASPRDSILNDIAARWRRFSRKDLAVLESTDELVTQLAAKYGLDRIDAQRDVDELLAGRRSAA